MSVKVSTQCVKRRSGPVKVNKKPIKRCIVASCGDEMTADTLHKNVMRTRLTVLLDKLLDGMGVQI